MLMYCHSLLGWTKGFPWMSFTEGNNLVLKAKMLVTQTTMMKRRTMTMTRRTTMTWAMKISPEKKVGTTTTMMRGIQRMTLQLMEMGEMMTSVMGKTKKRSKMRMKRINHPLKRKSENRCRSLVSFFFFIPLFFCWVQHWYMK